MRGQRHHRERHQTGVAGAKGPRRLTLGDVALQEAEQRRPYPLPHLPVGGLPLLEPGVRHHAVQVPVAFVPEQDGRHERAQQSLVVVPVREGLQTGHELARPLTRPPLKRRDVQIRLGRKILEDRGFADAGGPGDRLGGGAAKSAAAEQRDGNVRNLRRALGRRHARPGSRCRPALRRRRPAGLRPTRRAHITHATCRDYVRRGSNCHVSPFSRGSAPRACAYDCLVGDSSRGDEVTRSIARSSASRAAPVRDRRSCRTSAGHAPYRRRSSLWSEGASTPLRRPGAYRPRRG